MSVQDVIKKSILESDMYQQAITMEVLFTITVDLLAAMLLGIFIYAVYRHFYRGVVYSRNYAVSLVGMTVLTCMVTLAISTNIVISLGMVGALSIVRYRTAVKEPLDLMYMFWAITTGITIGASMYVLAGMAFVLMILMIVGFDGKRGRQQTYVMVVHYEGDGAGDEILRHLQKMSYTIRSRIMRGNETELTLQLRCKKKNQVFAEHIRDLDGVSDVTLLEFDGEYHG